jgi:hypothetical protein
LRDAYAALAQLIERLADPRENITQFGHAQL